MSSPIADLSYRNYDGPLESPTRRWWVIAKAGLRLAFRKKALWVLSALSAWYYLVMMAVLFFVAQFTEDSPMGEQAMGSFLNRLVWKDQFLHGFSYAQLPLLLLALLLGSGAIANDNRANALLVYLSKPCTKFDYLFGKWVGVFVPICVVLFVPTILFYIYGAMSFQEYGFVRDDPWMLPKMLVIIPLCAMMHASLAIGISSMFNQGRIAGAAYAGLYFLTNFFTVLMGGIYVGSRGKAPAIVETLYYASIDGVQIGLAKAILATNGTLPFGATGGRGSRGMTPVPAPELWMALLAFGILTGLGLLIAWRRVRAVEVVG